MSILTMKTVRMVKCMEITGLPREATISTVLRAWQNYRANYNKNHKSHPLTGKLKSAWLKLFLMAVSWGFVTLQQRLIWGKFDIFYLSILSFYGLASHISLEPFHLYLSQVWPFLMDLRCLCKQWFSFPSTSATNTRLSGNG